MPQTLFIGGSKDCHHTHKYASCYLVSGYTDVRVGFKMGLIDPKWDKT